MEDSISVAFQVGDNRNTFLSKNSQMRFFALSIPHMDLQKHSTLLFSYL